MMEEKEEKNEVFTYEYSARRQEEIRAIRRRYEPCSPETEKMERLRKLDESVRTAGTVPSLILGIAGTLLLGVGLCCTLVWMGNWFVPGILIGVAGIACVSLAYPLHSRLVRRRRELLTPQILQLTDELMK